MRRSVWERCMCDGRTFTRQFQYVLCPSGITGRFMRGIYDGRFIVRRPIGADLWDSADDTVVWVQDPFDPDSHIGL